MPDLTRINKKYPDKAIKQVYQMQKIISDTKEIDEINISIDISIEGKKRQIFEDIVLEAIDELSTKVFKKK